MDAQPPKDHRGIVPTREGVPAFTEEDVIRFLAAGGFRVTRGFTLNGDPKAIHISFLTWQELRAMLLLPDAFPAILLCCYAVVEGDYSFIGGPYRPNQQPYPRAAAFAIFDATTGRLLASGGQP